MSSIGTILNANGKQIVTDLQRSMSSKGLNASRKTSDSIKYEVSETLTKSVLKIIANRSIGALQYGRKPGRMPPRDVIRQWIDNKPLTLQGKMTKDQLAYLIQRKLGREGIKVPNRYNVGGVITDVINDELIARIFKEIKSASINRLVEATKKVKGGFAK